MTRENPSVRYPKGMRPLIVKYAEQIAKLASRTIHEVTGEPRQEQWSPDVEPLGAGAWGVVYPTVDPRFIVKVTADPTEGPIVDAIMRDPNLHNHMGIIHYFALRQIPEQITFRGKPFDVYVIVAERLKDVGGLSNWSSSREDRNLAHWLIKLKDVATKRRKEQEKKRPSQHLLDTLQEQYFDIVGRIQDGPLSDFFYQFFDSTGVLVADVHLGNFGKRAVDWQKVNADIPLGGGDWHWVVSDPGHTVLSGEQPVEVLRENPAAVVRTPRDERLWERAKARAAEQGRPGDWPYIMGIFQRMQG